MNNSLNPSCLYFESTVAMASSSNQIIEFNDVIATSGQPSVGRVAGHRPWARQRWADMADDDEEAVVEAEAPTVPLTSTPRAPPLRVNVITVTNMDNFKSIGIPCSCSDTVEWVMKRIKQRMEIPIASQKLTLCKSELRNMYKQLKDV